MFIFVQPKLYSMKIKAIASIHLLFVLFLLINSCKNGVKMGIVSPMPEFDKSYTLFSVDAQKGGVFQYQTGSEITIPPDGFADSLGNPVTGTVTLKYREMHDAVDIFLTGIDLNYDTAGTKEILKTAGMFEIRALQQGKNLTFAKGKKANVKMAGFTLGNNYNFYSYNENSKNWEYKGYDSARINVDKITKKKELNEKLPKLKFPLDKGYFALNYNALLDVFFNDNYSVISNNQKSKKPGQKAETYGMQWHEINAYQSIFYKGLRFHAAMMVWKRISENEIPKAWLKKSWLDQITPLGDNKYNLTIMNENQKTYTIKAEAIMPIKTLFSQPAEKWKTDYDQIMKNFDEQIEKMKFMADVYRSFEVEVTGYHNWDVVEKRPEKVVVSGDFNVKFDDASTPVIYYFLAGNKSFVKIPKEDWGKLQIVPDSSAHLLAVLNTKTVAVFTNEQYRKINFDSLRKVQNPVYSFKMISKPVSSSDEIKKMIGMKL